MTFSAFSIASSPLLARYYKLAGTPGYIHIYSVLHIILQFSNGYHVYTSLNLLLPFSLSQCNPNIIKRLCLNIHLFQTTMYIAQLPYNTLSYHAQ
jgi:hypothetical protein